VDPVKGSYLDRGREIPPGTDSVELALRVRGHLDVTIALFRSYHPDDFDGRELMKQPGMSTIQQSLAGLLAEYADCDADGYAGMLMVDHIEAWENNGAGLERDELVGMLDELLEQKPWRHLRVSAGGDGLIDAAPMTPAGREQILAAVSSTLHLLVTRQVGSIVIQVAPGKAREL
jgi:hypothetical protein